MRTVHRIALACGALLLCLPILSLAQEIRYVYDELNRLVGVVDQQGNAAEYVYDAVGNLLQIKRVTVDPSADVSISLVSPNKGGVGTTVQLFGKGFSPTPGQNTVTFSGGAAATVTSATSTSLKTTVPPGATTGLITLTTPLGIATSPEPFTVLQGFAVVPDRATVLLGKPYSFQASLDGTPTSAVTWRVNGIVGGSSQLGTISPMDLYSAPGTLPLVSPLLIEAVLSADPGRVAAAQVTLLPASAGSLTTARLSVGPPQGPLTASPLVAPTLSVGPPPPVLTASPLPTVLLSVSPVPAITAVSPGGASRGSTVSVTLTGVGLVNATALVALRNGTADPLITVSGLTANPEGTRLTATFTLDTTAPAGGRILQVTAGGQTSTPLGTGTNAFTVQ